MPAPLLAGRVAGIWRHAVKSMAAEPLREADVGWHGVAGDRRWAFVRAGLERSGFPYLTIRERSDMGAYVPVLDDPGRPESSRLRVRTPSGAELDVTDPALAVELHPAGARVIRLDRGLFDAAPLSLLTTQALAGLGDLVGAELDVRRFRPNLLVEAAGGEWPEDAWVGAVLRMGGLRMRVDRRDPRCVVTNVDPVTGERDPRVLRAIAAERETCLGVYGTPVEPGRVRIGDPVTLER